MPERAAEARCEGHDDARRSTSPSDLEAGRASGPDAGSVRSVSRQRSREGGLARLSQHISLGADNPIEHTDTRRRRRASSSSSSLAETAVEEEDDSVYDRLAPRRKIVVVALLSFCSFLAPISSTSVLAATPEVAAEYDTTGSVVNVANAVYMFMMGVSPIVWGPLSQVYGRRIVSWAPFSLRVAPFKCCFSFPFACRGKGVIQEGGGFGSGRQEECKLTCRNADQPDCSRSVLRMQHWHSSGSEFGRLLHLPGSDRV